MRLACVVVLSRDFLSTVWLSLFSGLWAYFGVVILSIHPYSRKNQPSGKSGTAFMAAAMLFVFSFLLVLCCQKDNAKKEAHEYQSYNEALRANLWVKYAVPPRKNSQSNVPTYK